MKRYSYLIGRIGCTLSAILLVLGVFLLIFTNLVASGFIEWAPFWFCISFSIVSLVIGIVFYIIGYRQKQRETTRWECEECGTEISESDKTCPKCGVEFD